MARDGDRTRVDLRAALGLQAEIAQGGGASDEGIEEAVAVTLQLDAAGLQIEEVQGVETAADSVDAVGRLAVIRADGEAANREVFLT